jgi:Heterokaryon incompatibility protein (HET)
MALVRALGERYLWVDALCIVQDDEENKTRQIANMDVVYGKAFATVVAIHGASADAGLPGVRPGTRPPQRIETLVAEAGPRDLDYDPGGSDSSAANLDGRGRVGSFVYRLRQRHQQVTLHLVATPPPLQFAIEASRWHTRGWTFQECLLSRRCLYFSECYVYFQCGRRDKVLSECGVNGPVRRKDDWDSWDTPGEAPGAKTLNNPLSGLQQELADLGPDARRAKIFTVYSRLVEKYTLRKLSYDSDIINAFLGTFTVLNEFFHSDILCGLPASALDLALLWAPAGRLPRRGHTARTMGTLRGLWGV